ncbi:hypothetical protein LCGC14_1269320 [marine sediment metagenome]|uniref:Uncharacterized protein n=1 Tax=marine sediment metagenome TaxID=412755 RepID=A0A0F9L0F5_9ZZZZ|nr:hypothetical protein [bacterium]
MTLKEIKKQLDSVEDEGEAMKLAAELLAPKEAYCDVYKTSLRKQIHAQIMGELAAIYVRQGTRYTESRLEREARDSGAYKNETEKYGKALEIKIFLRTYLAGVKMSHEMKIASTYKISSEIKRGLYEKGM